MDRAALRAVPSLSGSRIPTLPAAAALLEALVTTLKPSALVICAYGLREGLLFRELTPEQRRLDPLLAAAREVGGRYGRFDDHGDLIDRWIAPVFPHDGATDRRLRLAACLLADIAWGAHPDFRAERAVDMAIHGNWVGIDAAGRAMLGLTLFSAFGGTHGFDGRIAALCDPASAKRAHHWGLAIRVAQRWLTTRMGQRVHQNLRDHPGAHPMRQLGRSLAHTMTAWQTPQVLADGALYVHTKPPISWFNFRGAEVAMTAGDAALEGYLPTLHKALRAFDPVTVAVPL